MLVSNCCCFWYLLVGLLLLLSRLGVVRLLEGDEAGVGVLRGVV